MTGQPQQRPKTQDLTPQVRISKSPKRRARWPWVLLGTGLVLGGVAAYSPALLGGLLLARLGEQAGVSGGKVSGPLWSPTIRQAAVNLPGLSATAGRATVTATSVNPLNHTAHIKVALNDARVNLDLKKLLSGNGKSGGGTGGGWKVILDAVDIQHSKLNVNGKGINVPDVTTHIDRAPDGALLLHGHTAEGPLSSQVRLGHNAAGGTTFSVKIDADARVIRHYWKGVEAGRIKGQYLFGDGDIKGDLRVINATLRVPEAHFVKVSGVGGFMQHRGNKIAVKLAGHGWNGPVTARGGVDTKAEHWTVTADAAPTMSGLARALGTTGEGHLKLRVTAGGWSSTRVKGYVQGNGKLAGIPFRDGNAEYTFLNHEGAAHTGQTNDLKFSAQTELAGQQKLTGQWAFGRAGTASLVGGFANKALDLQTTIDAKNDLTFSGSGLGGPLRGTLALKGLKLAAVLNPDYGQAKAHLVLSGTPENLNIAATHGVAGPFNLAGSGHYGKAGLQADLGSAKLNLDRNFKGTWQLSGLTGAGISLSGGGQLNLPGGDVAGQLQAKVPGVAQTLSGPINLNYVRQRGSFTPTGQKLTWQGSALRVQAANLAVAGGARVSGNLLVTTQLRAFGNLTAVGNGYHLSAQAHGKTASVRGSAGGVRVQATSDLSAPYHTQASLQGTDISATISVQNGVRFTLNTLGDRASGVLDGQNWNAAGRVNLAALRPLLPLKDLAGTLDLHLAGLGGGAQVSAQASGARVAGTLSRAPGSAAGGRLLADLQATLPEVGGERPSAHLSGQLYPQVQAAGRVHYLGQTLNTALSGPYSNLAARLTGRTTALTFKGVTLPGQAVNVTGTLTPKLTASGTWGDLNAAYDGAAKVLKLGGAQQFSAFGKAGTVQGRATWGPGLTAGPSGAVDARGKLGQYRVALSGPWSRLNVLLDNSEGLRGVGTASLPAGKYDLNIAGPLTLPGQGQLLLDGHIQGTGAEPRGTVLVRDTLGGQATVNLNGLRNLRLNAQHLTLAGQALQGNLTATGGVLNGRLQAGPLSIVATGGRIKASGSYAGQHIDASAKLALPATVSELNMRVNGPYLSAAAAGSLTNLRGSVSLKPQTFGNDAASLSVPAQTFALQANLSAPRASIGGLSWRGGQWSGELNLLYALRTQAQALQQAGQLRLHGAASTLTAFPSGPLDGQLQVLPALGGTVSARLSPFMGLLPGNMRGLIVPGRLVAQVRATGADIKLQQTQYLAEPLGLNAHLDWRNKAGVQVQGAVTHPGSRLPLVYDGQNLSIRAATLDAHALQPVLRGASGTIKLDLDVPRLKFAGASGQAAVNIAVRGQQAQRQSARGTVTLRGGQLAANLQSTLSGVNVQVRGPIYPQADAVLHVGSGKDSLDAALQGQASQTLTLRGGGVYSGEKLDFVAAAKGLTGGAASATISGSGAGSYFDVKLAQGRGNGLAAWSTTGTVNVFDLRPLTAKTGRRLAGQARASFSGKPSDFHLQLSGAAEGAAFQAKLNQGAGNGLAAWTTSGTVNIPDLKPFAGTAGQVSAVFGGTLAHLQLNAAGEAAGVKFNAPAQYIGRVLRVNGAKAILAQGDVLASGTVFPKLALTGKANIHDVLPGQYSAQVTGTFARPDLSVSGKLSSDLSGLQVAGTALSARLQGKNWRATFTGPKLAGTARGQLGGNVAGGLQNVALKLHTAYTSGEHQVRLDGPAAWNTKAGWQVRLRAAGNVPGGPLDAALTGQGTLNFAGTLGAGDQQAAFSGQLPAALPLKPAGTLTVTRLDAGAFWGRAGQLRATGTAKLGGAAWNRVRGTFAGDLQDAAGELSGNVQASYGVGGGTGGGTGDVQASLQGEHVQGQATLRAGRYDATLKTEPLRLARLLPTKLGVDALTLGGQAELRGSLAGGPESVLLQNVALSGEQGQVGPFSLSGSAQYLPQRDVLKANLKGSLRGGLFSAQGDLPSGLNILVNGVPTSYAQAASFGSGKVNANIKLTGRVRNPYMQGQVSAVTDQLAASLILSGSVDHPGAHAKVTLLKGTTGTLYADASELDLKAGTLLGKVYGTLQNGGNRARVNLAGVWPNLTGDVQAQVAGLGTPVLLTGNGQGDYNVAAGQVGGGKLTLSRTHGFIPTLSGHLELDALQALKGSKGQALVKADLSGSLSNPALSASVTTLKAGVSDAELADTTGTFSATSRGVSGTLQQAGQTVATLSGQNLTLTELKLNAAGSTLRASGQAKLNGTADLALTAMGSVQGNLKASYASKALALSGQVAAQGFNGAVDIKASQDAGWAGTVRVTGGPSGLLTDSANLSVKGPLGQPLVTGSAGLLGAGGKIVASASGVQLRLVDGPGATASGAVEVRPGAAGEWTWSGATSLTRPELSLSVTPSGLLTDPQLLLSLRRGEWRASGAASKDKANLALTDGEKSGTLTWDGQVASVNLPGLNLAHLQLAGVNGLVAAKGSVSTAAKDGASGAVNFNIQNFTSAASLPVVGIKPAGDVAGQVTLAAGKPQLAATAALNTGPLTVNIAQTTSGGRSQWVGAVKGEIRKDQGKLALSVLADATGIHGAVNANQFMVDVAGQTAALSGNVALNGQTFKADLRAGHDAAVLTAEGGLADALPTLANILPVKATGEGYSARALLNEIDVSHMKLAPNLSGQVSGEANINDGGGTFFLKTDNLKVGPQTLPSRVEGTLVGGSWRLRGFLGQSDFTAGLNAKSQVFGQATLRALPLGAVLGAFTDSTPGEGTVTGIARFRFPLADPASGSATVVAERIRVSTNRLAGVNEPGNTTAVKGNGSAPAQQAAGLDSSAQNKAPSLAAAAGSAAASANVVPETLTGSGSLDFANRELRNINVQLSGAGTWDVQGEYTHQKVDLNAKFTDTTFTPVLRLIPGLAALEPGLKGTVTLSAAGTYDRPRGLLRAQNLNGSVAGLSLQIPQFSGDLPGSGAFTAGGRVLTGGTVGSDGNVNINGQLTLGKLSGTQVKFAGLLAPQALGALPNTTATISQSGDQWLINAQSLSRAAPAGNAALGAGTLNVSGTLSPKWDFTVTSRNYNLPLAVIYAKQSALDADLRVVDDGQLVHVSGAGDFNRLILGRVASTNTIPAPGDNTQNTRTQTSNFVSPLPEEYTTFPKPATGEAAAKPALPFLNRLVLNDLQIRAPNDIRIDEDLARAEFSTAGLLVRGTGAQPKVSGDILSQRGSIFLRENEFKIIKGNISFAGEGLYPTFNIVAEGLVTSSSTRQNVPITLTVSGDFRTQNGQPNILYLDTKLSCSATAGAACLNSDTGAPYSEQELYALVATGVPDLASLPSNLSALGNSALQTALNVFVLGEIERTLAKALGVDVLRLTPTLASDGTVNATFTVGSYVTRQLFLQYQVDLSGKGLVGATYNTPDNRFTFEASTPLVGLNLQSIRPNIAAAYNLSKQTSLTVGVENSTETTKYKFGITYRIGAR